MKLLVVTPYYAPKIGGLENYARQLNYALKSLAGWEIVVVTSGNGTRDIVDGMPVYRLRTWLKFSNTPLSPFWPRQLRAIIRKERPDIILAHTPVPSMADAAALACGSTPLVLIDHAATLFKHQAPLFNTVAWLYQAYQRVTMRRASRIVAVSPYVRSRLHPKLQSKTVVIPNSVWRAEAVGRTHQPKLPNFLFIGSLDSTHAWKGLDLIIEAIAIYRDRYDPRVALTVIGDGTARNHYEARVSQYRLGDAVTFAGAITGQAKDAHIASSSAMILYPTSANDALPTVMLEAWAHGVPVVAAAIGALPTLIDNHVDGYLVPPHDPAALAEGLHTLMASGERQTLAESGLQRLRGNYTWERQAEAFADLVREVI